MCIEIISAGAFNGIGKTIPPSFVGVLFNGIRIPASMWLSSIAALGLTGVWWSISITSIFKGVVLTIWFIIFLEKHPVIRQKRVSI
jgi:Na+-driven multidrug efflux pump